jgi:hypothetical protein
MPGTNLEALYKNRFDDHMLESRKVLWQTLCRDFFQNYVPKNSVVLDIAAGYCEFINNSCPKEWISS